LFFRVIQFFVIQFLLKILIFKWRFILFLKIICCQALIWDTSAKQPDRELEPILVYSAGAEINQVQWSAAQSEWVAIAFANKLQILRVSLPT
jgi:hypothetical protein